MFVGHSRSSCSSTSPFLSLTPSIVDESEILLILSYILGSASLLSFLSPFCGCQLRFYVPLLNVNCPHPEWLVSYSNHFCSHIWLACSQNGDSLQSAHPAVWAFGRRQTPSRHPRATEDLYRQSQSLSLQRRGHVSMRPTLVHPDRYE